MENKAIQRWEQQLQQVPGASYAEAIGKITQSMIDSATNAEVNQHGSGHRLLLDALEERGGK